jgi:murein DD-endopeptidase MepM/ murein hydrolase activator NlpD
MAVSAPVRRVIFTANESKKGVTQGREGIKNIGQVILKRTKVKREAFAQTNLFRKRREESEKRMMLEDELEAPRVAATPTGAQQLVEKTGAKGFFNRILGFLGYLAAGWLMNNLPTWIAMGKEFIARIQKAGEIVSGFFNNTIKLFTGFGSLLSSLGQNLLQFDFFDTSNRVKNSMSELNNTMGSLTGQIEEAFSLLTTPLTEGKYSGEEIPETGTQQTDQGAYTEPPPYAGSGGGGGRWKPLLDVIASGEGGYESVNPGQVVPGLTQMTIAEAWQTAQQVGKSKRGSGAMGRYQLLSDPIGRAKRAGLDPYKDKFSPENQDKIAVYILENIRYGKDWLSGKLNDSAFAQGIADEWAGVPNLSGRYSYSGQGGKVKASSVKSALSQVKKGYSQPQPSRQESQIQQVPVGNVNPTIGDRLGAGRGHKGVDLQVKMGTPLRAISDGVIVDSDFEKGWGNFLVMKDDRGIYHLYGHMQSGYKRGGPVKKGEVIGKVGMTGRTSGPHLHWEAGTGWNGGQVTGRFDALSRYSKFAPFNTQPGPGVVEATPAQIAAAPQQSQTVPSALTPERRGQDIVIIDQPRQQQNIITPAASGGGAAPSPISDFDLLNNFIKNKLLLDLAYL